MQREILLEYLDAAKRHAGHSKASVEAQKRVIAALVAMGKDVTEAEKILQILERAQTDDLSDMEQILNALESALLDEESARS